MDAANQPGEFHSGDAESAAEKPRQARRRRRLRGMETQFRLLCAATGRPENSDSDRVDAAPPTDSYGDLRAALWLLRRPRKSGS